MPGAGACECSSLSLSSGDEYTGSHKSVYCRVRCCLRGAAIFSSQYLPAEDEWSSGSGKPVVRFRDRIFVRKNEILRETRCCDEQIRH